jgi:hypothetical protein
MGLFSKKEQIPIFPTASSLPPLLPLLPLPPIKEEPNRKDLPELPSFPTGFKNRNLNQKMVKSAVSDVPSFEEEEVDMEMPRNLYITEEISGESRIPPRPLLQTSRPQTQPKQTPVPQVQQKQNETIYIRIDKFQSAQKNLEEIKSKISEMESILRKIKDVKSREEKELKEWTEDIENLKSRLAEIDDNIFGQL